MLPFRFARFPLLTFAVATLALLILATPLPAAKRNPDAAALAKKDFNVLAYGAKGDGTTKDSAAIASAIDAAAAAGGGRVVFPKGVFLTGPINLKSNVELHLSTEHATIVFSTDVADYPLVFTRWEATECYNWSPQIYARDAVNIAITGNGLIDGQGRFWHPMNARQKPAVERLRKMGEDGTPVEQRRFGTVADALRPQMIQFIGCKGVRIEGVSITGSPFWTIHPLYCEDVIVRDVAIMTRGPNTDGIDPESCKNVLIERTFFSTGDDCIAIKSGRDKDGRVVGRPCENITIRDCLMVNGHGAVSIGSEMSGGVRHVRISNIEARGTDRIIRVKSQRGRGGVVEDLVVENCRGRALLEQAIELTFAYSGKTPAEPFSDRTPVFKNFTFRNITSDGAPQAIKIEGLEESLISDIAFENVSVRADTGAGINYGAKVRFTNCTITPARGEKFTVTNSREVSVDGKKL